MLSKNLQKTIKSLHSKKGRETHNMFMVEGYKSILELLESKLQLIHIIAVEQTDFPEKYYSKVIITDQATLKMLSTLKTPPGIIAVFEIPKQVEIEHAGMIVALDKIQDPGNLGTIIRLCDWFGITQLWCTTDTVDAYNPKTIQASMASIARVAIHYLDLEEILKQTSIPIYTTAMNDDSIYDLKLPENGILVLGNESHGVSDAIMKLGHKITIPQYGNTTTESLNVAMATAVLLSEWRRKI